MHEVAALAGVSLKTVSRVVNAEPGVSPELRARVTRAVRALDYRLDPAASGLRRGAARTGVIGVLVPDLADPASGELLSTLEEAVGVHGHRLLVGSLGGEAGREEELLHDLVSRRVDGVVLVPATARQGHLPSELRSGTPMVVVDRVPRGVSADSVAIDHASGAREAGAHLAAVGHRRVAALFQDQPEVVSAQRLEGLSEGLPGWGRRPPATLVREGLGSVDEAREALLGLLDGDDPPTAVVTSGPASTSGAVQALSGRGLRRAVAHVALDDTPSATGLEPALTVVRYDVPRLGAVAAELLLERISGRGGRARRVVLRPSLVERGSGEFPPPLLSGAGAGPGA